MTGHRLANDPNAMLLAAYVPAWIAGEHRLEVEGDLCPLLCANLQIAAASLRSWFPQLGEPPEVVGPRRRLLRKDGVALFISGGVDSLSMVRDLTRDLPKDHPDRPRAAVLIDYQEIRGISEDESERRFTQRRAICGRLCEESGLDLIAIRTNLRALNGNMDDWMTKIHGAFLAGIAHACSSDYGIFNIASTYDYRNLAPWGSHPLLDPYYSSSHMMIRHHGVDASRLDKVRSLLDWQSALDEMNVCTATDSGGFNCGACEKCIRTRLELLALGALDRAGAFPPGQPTVADLGKVRFGSGYSRACYMETLPDLRARGHDDLVKAIEGLDRKYQRRLRRGPVARGLVEAMRHAQRRVRRWRRRSTSAR